jgi:glycosyltransferase involved in cell wall biosynthesis
MNIKLSIIGDGPLREELSHQIEKLDAADKISLLGAQSRDRVMVELYNSHLFGLTGIIATSVRVETQGVVFAEAQATGLPVIGSDVGGVSDSFINGKTGMLFPPGDISAIKRSIRFFDENRQDIHEFGKRGRKFVLANFSLNKMLDKFEELYNELMG